ncbi:MAG: PEGA domain-containing protein [Myxococcota bacterium]
MALLVMFGLLFSPAAPPAVMVLPLTPEAGVSAKQARGIDALLQKQLRGSDFLNALPAQRQDARQAFRCGRDAGCLARLGYARGADLIAAGTIAPTDEGYRVRLFVVDAASGTLVREVEEPVIGTVDDMTAWLDRLSRSAFAPQTLAGGLWLAGQPVGARVSLDGAFAGVLPLSAVVEGLVEGEHEIVVEHPGYRAFRRRFDVRFREVTSLEVTLVQAAADDLEEDVLRSAPTNLNSPLLRGLIFGGAGTTLALGIVFGGLAFVDQLEVERRAEAQQLILPRDEVLLTRGKTYAWLANVAYGAAVALSLGGIALAGADLLTVTSREESRALESPAAGAPRADEMRPGFAP